MINPGRSSPLDPRKRTAEHRLPVLEVEHRSSTPISGGAPEQPSHGPLNLVASTDNNRNRAYGASMPRRPAVTPFPGNHSRGGALAAVSTRCRGAKHDIPALPAGSPPPRGLEAEHSTIAPYIDRNGNRRLQRAGRGVEDSKQQQHPWPGRGEQPPARSWLQADTRLPARQ